MSGGVFSPLKPLEIIRLALLEPVGLGHRAAHGDAQDFVPPNEGEIHRFIDEATEGAPQIVLGEAPDVLAIDEEQFVSRSNARLVRGEVFGNVAHVDAAVCLLDENGPDRPASRRAQTTTENSDAPDRCVSERAPEEQAA
jgi:hypothetical protein